MIIKLDRIGMIVVSRAALFIRLCIIPNAVYKPH